MPYPVITEYSRLRFSGESGGPRLARVIIDPQAYLEFDQLPDPRRPGDADRFPHRIGGEKFVANFGTELRGLAVGGLPGVDLINENDLYCAAGFARSSISAVSHAFQLGDIHDEAVGGDVYPVGLTVDHDGREYAAGECVLDAVFHFPANGICTIDWAAQGYLAAAFSGLTDLPLVPATESAGEPLVGTDATVVITPAGSPGIGSLVWHNFDIMLNNVRSHPPSLGEPSGYARPRITARDVQLVGEFEAVGISTLDMMDLLENRTVLTIAITLGAVAGNICTITGQFVLNTIPEAYDREGLLSCRMTAKMHPSGPLTITWT